MPKSKCTKHLSLGALLEVEMSKKRARGCGAKRVSKSTCTKHTSIGALLEVEISQKVHVVVARRTFPSHKCKKVTGMSHFWAFRCRFAWLAQGIVHLVKSEQKRKNEANLRDFFQNGKLSAELCQCVLGFFHSICVKCCACHATMMPDHTKWCTCHAKSSSQT